MVIRITVSPFKVFAVNEIEISNPTEWEIDANEKRLPCGHDKKNIVYGARRVFCAVCGQGI